MHYLIGSLINLKYITSTAAFYSSWCCLQLICNYVIGLPLTNHVISCALSVKYMQKSRLQRPYQRFIVMSQHIINLVISLWQLDRHTIL